MVNYNITITYDDPKSYKGPVILGWEPDKDRNTSVYVRPKENTILLDPFSCWRKQSSPLTMVVIQHSAPKNFEIRMANRATWMNYAQK